MSATGFSNTFFFFKLKKLYFSSCRYGNKPLNLQDFDLCHSFYVPRIIRTRK